MTGEQARKRLESTRYLQFQLAEVHKNIDELEDEIQTMENAKCWGTKLTSNRYRLEFLKGRREALQEIWDVRNEKGLF